MGAWCMQRCAPQRAPGLAAPPTAVPSTAPAAPRCAAGALPRAAGRVGGAPASLQLRAGEAAECRGRLLAHLGWHGAGCDAVGGRAGHGACTAAAASAASAAGAARVVRAERGMCALQVAARAPRRLQNHSPPVAEPGLQVGGCCYAPLLWATLPVLQAAPPRPLASLCIGCCCRATCLPALHSAPLQPLLRALPRLPRVLHLPAPVLHGEAGAAACCGFARPTLPPAVLAAPTTAPGATLLPAGRGGA